MYCHDAGNMAAIPNFYYPFGGMLINIAKITAPVKLSDKSFTVNKYSNSVRNYLYRKKAYLKKKCETC